MALFNLYQCALVNHMETKGSLFLSSTGYPGHQLMYGPGYGSAVTHSKARELTYECPIHPSQGLSWSCLSESISSGSRGRSSQSVLTTRAATSSRYVFSPSLEMVAKCAFLVPQHSGKASAATLASCHVNNPSVVTNAYRCWLVGYVSNDTQNSLLGRRDGAVVGDSEGRTEGAGVSLLLPMHNVLLLLDLDFDLYSDLDLEVFNDVHPGGAEVLD